jgi:hypothetical protein
MLDAGCWMLDARDVTHVRKTISALRPGSLHYDTTFRDLIDLIKEQGQCNMKVQRAYYLAFDLSSIKRVLMSFFRAKFGSGPIWDRFSK